MRTPTLGFPSKLVEALYRFARRRPQLTRGPAAANLLQMLMVQTSLLVLGCNRIHAYTRAHFRLDTECAQCQCLLRQSLIRGGAFSVLPR